MISKELRTIFAQAVSYAKTSHHEYLTLEHIFMMLLHDEIIETLFVDLGVDSSKIFEDMKKYIDENTPKLPEGITDEPIETMSLSSTIEYMVAHIQSSGRSKAGVEDMFVAILKDEKTYASYLLKKMGIQKVDILEEISHKDSNEDEENDFENNDNKVLKNNSTELVAVAKKGEIDPVIGRDLEISRVIEVLSRRKKNFQKSSQIRSSWSIYPNDCGRNQRNRPENYSCSQTFLSKLQHETGVLFWLRS